MKVRRRSKYNSSKCVYNGVKYDSAGEAAYAQKLDLLTKAGEILGYERQVKIPLRVNGQLICTYIADFIVYKKDGKKEIHEFKGYMTREFKIKWRLLNALKDEIFGGGSIELLLVGDRLSFGDHVHKKRHV